MTGGSRAWTTQNLTYMMYGMKTRDPDSERSVQQLRFSSHVLGSEGEHGTKVVFKLEISGAQERTDNVSCGEECRKKVIIVVKEVGKRQNMYRWRLSSLERNHGTRAAKSARIRQKER